MVVHAEQERVRLLLKEAIPLLCKNGLTYNREFCIEALVGITLDQNDVFLVSIKETVKGDIEVSTHQVDTGENETTAAPEPMGKHQGKEHSPKSSRKRSRQSVDRYSRDVRQEESDDSAAFEIIGDVTPMKRERHSGHFEDEQSSEKTDTVEEKYSYKNHIKNDDDEDSDELVVIKCEPPVMGDYHEGPNYSMGNVSTFDTTSAGENFYSSFPGTSSGPGPGLVVSNVTHVGNDAAESNSEQGPMNDAEIERKFMCKIPHVNQWMCTLCSRPFTWKTSLKRHIIGSHFSVERYKCQSCGKTFKWHSTFAQHKNECEKKLERFEQNSDRILGTGTGQNSDSAATDKA